MTPSAEAGSRKVGSPVSPPRARRWVRRAWPLLILVVANALFFWRFFTPVERDRLAFEPGDYTETFLGFHRQTYTAFVAGRWPDWVDCLWSGYPLGADPQSQVFYPPKWVTFLGLRALGFGHFPIEALDLEVAAHYALLSLGMYGWLRDQRLRRGAAVLGALTFAYGGYAMGYAPLQSAVLMTATWLPFLLWSVHRLARDGRPRDLGAAALAGALAFYAGHPQTLLLIALLAAAYGLFASRQHARNWRWIMPRLGGLAALIVALAAAQLAPTLAFNAVSTRASIAYAEAGNGFPFVDVLQLLITGVVSHWHPLFVGLLPLSLVVFSLRRPRPNRWFWLAVGVIGLVLSFGERAGWTGALFNLLPGWALFRGQERLAIWVSFSLATLAAYGADDAFGPLTRAARISLARGVPRTVALWGVFALLALALVLLARLDLDRTDWRALPDRAGVMWLGASLAGAFWLLRARAMRWARAALPVLAAAAVITELYAANRPLNIVPAFDPLAPTPLLEPVLQTRASDPDAFFRVADDGGLPGHAGCLYGYSHIDGRTPIQLATYARFRQRLPEPVQWQLLGVAFITTGRADVGNPGAVVVGDNGQSADSGQRIQTFRLSTVPQRAWLSHSVIVSGDVETSLADIARAEDVFSTAWWVDEAPGVAAPSGPESVTVISDAPGSIRLSVGASAPGVLTVSEPYAPGWRATLNGQPIDTHISDGTLIGLAVPAGLSDVRLTYAPAEELPARLISAAALLATLGLMAAGHRLRP